MFHFKKKEVIVKEGATSNYVYFVNDGILRSYYLKDGEEVTTQFYFPNSYCSSYSSFLTQSKGRINIECLSDVELLALSYENVQRMYKSSTAFNTFGRRISEFLYIDFYKRSSSFLLDDAKTRYLTLLKERPEILKSIPNYMIASYIGITPESLSRLKKQLLSE
ncbi:Crp/Fnr family transcriptional regulator [Hyunsoonleella flava]|uniref:Crp/Fnr family transcriptional regulator n=2 Tax=Hyunsoonleella flava TaxID=2527939 RepID=A0A4V2J9T4_9FLAO|nr:Crp/Fnr family transcriptional regulator [Hyunsoonleella flava]